MPRSRDFVHEPFGDQDVDRGSYVLSLALHIRLDDVAADRLGLQLEELRDPLHQERGAPIVPLVGVTIGPDDLQVSVTKAQVKDAPSIELEGDELSQADESTLYHHYQLNYTPSATPSGRRLARR